MGGIEILRCAHWAAKPLGFAGSSAGLGFATRTIVDCVVAWIAGAAGDLLVASRGIWSGCCGPIARTRDVYFSVGRPALSQ